ncbi:MAG: hypothetical protein ACD_3C00081G0004 [uncultured bacterium (gcode 4)]|uniref:Uncharacterized protein n=1 Tax=uncultured bacterium (gcode 4) TaxID=1234023 RepID=K2G224_9BACT|nr:MAG: hypothetical protein ACD_3C00081G0004 [uncultured bacterium (gcode 4)]
MKNYLNENWLPETYLEMDRDYMLKIVKEWAQLRDKLKNDYFEKTFDIDVRILFDWSSIGKPYKNDSPEYVKDVKKAEAISDSLYEKRQKLIVLNARKKLWTKDVDKNIQILTKEIEKLNEDFSSLINKYPQSPEISFFSMISNYGFDNKKFVIWMKKLMEVSDKYEYEIFVFFKNYSIEIWRDWIKKKWEFWYELQELVFKNFKSELQKIINHKLKDSNYPENIKNNFMDALDLLDKSN